ncbi:MAG: leucine-rich repeat domain-containing protein, partial [Planctomycetota bacterium]
MSGVRGQSALISPWQLRLALRQLLMLAAFSSCSVTPKGAPERYAFTLDGKPFKPHVLSMNGTPDDPRPGDLISVDGIWMTLGPKGTYDFRSSRESNGLVTLVDGDATRVVGAEVTWVEEDDKKTLTNPLKDLSDEEIRGLRGVRLAFWSDGILGRLGQIDAARCCVTVRYYTFYWPEDLQAKKTLPVLPRGLRYLFVCDNEDWYKTPTALASLGSLDALRVFTLQSNTYPGKFDVALIKKNGALRYLCLEGKNLANGAELAGFPELRFLYLHGADGLEDFSFLRQMKELRRLDLGLTDIADSAALAECTRLRYLNLENCDELHEINGLKGMADLETLDIEYTAVSDLSPLSGLAALTRVDAHGTAVTRLPDGPLPSLQKLDILSGRVFRNIATDGMGYRSGRVHVSAGVSEDAIAAFRNENPGCRVLHTWTAVLHEKLAGTTRVRVRSGGACAHTSDEEIADRKTLVEVAEPAVIAEIIGHLRINEEESDFGCGCCGYPTFEFCKGDTLLASLSLHHGRSVRWRKGRWPGDGMLLAEDASFLVKWLADRGVTLPLEQVEAEKAEERAMANKLRRATEGMSEALRQSFDGDDDRAFRDAL